MRVRHPQFPEIVRDVDNPARWAEHGWVPVVQPVKPKPRHRKYPLI